MSITFYCGLNVLKCQGLDNLEIEILISDSELCHNLFNEFLEICCDDNNNNDASLIICCLEFVSHWYFIRDQFLESLFHRQNQLQL